MLQRHILGTVVVALFLLINGALVVHAVTTRDVRFGWGMFATYTRYSITYHKIYLDGTSERYDSAGDLVGDARVLLPEVMRTTLFGSGVVTHWVRNYCAYIAENSRDTVQEVTATIHFRENYGAPQETTVRCNPS